MDPEEQTWKEPRSSSVLWYLRAFCKSFLWIFFPMLLGTQCPQSCKMCAWNALKMHIFFKFNSFHIHRTLGYLVHLNKMRLHLKIYSFFSPQGILFVCLSVYLLGGSSLGREVIDTWSDIWWLLDICHWARTNYCRKLTLTWPGYPASEARRMPDHVHPEWHHGL